MDPQTFVRLSVGQLGLKLPGANASKAARACHCEVRLRGFPVQTAPVPLIHSPEFSLDESDLKALPTPGCFRAPQPYLEVAVYLGRRGGHCGVIAGMKRLVGVVRVDVGPEWRDGKPVLLRHGWTGVGRGEARPELHLRVKLEADPRYVFQFEDEVVLNPQVVQLHGAVRQPIFSCKFIRDRRPSQTDSLGGQYYSSSSGEEKEMEGAEGLEGGDPRPVMAAAFVPATGCDRVSRSNPGAWLIVRADTTGSSESWQPWGRLEAWREGATPSRDAVRLRLHLLPERRDDCVLVSETPLSCEKGGEFVIDMDRHAADAAAGVPHCAASLGAYSKFSAGNNSRKHSLNALSDHKLIILRYGIIRAYSKFSAGMNALFSMEVNRHLHVPAWCTAVLRCWPHQSAIIDCVGTAFGSTRQ